MSSPATRDPASRIRPGLPGVRGVMTPRILALLLVVASAFGPVRAGLPVAVAADASRATENTAAGAAALVRVLKHFHAAGDGEGGFAWWRSLPFAVRAQQVERPEVRLWRNRIEFLRDAQRGDGPGCAVSGPALLRLPMPTEDLAIERERLRHCTERANPPVSQ